MSKSAVVKSTVVKIPEITEIKDIESFDDILSNKIMPTQKEKNLFNKTIINRIKTDAKNKYLIRLNKKFSIEKNKARIHLDDVLSRKHPDNIRDNPDVGNIDEHQINYVNCENAVKQQETNIKIKLEKYGVKKINEQIRKYNKKVRIVNKTNEFNDRHMSISKSKYLITRSLSNKTKRSNVKRSNTRHSKKTHNSI